MKKILALFLLFACMLGLCACVPDIEPDISSASMVKITGEGLGQITVDDPQILSELCDRIYAMEREYTDLPGWGTRYVFQWFDASGNSMGSFTMYRGGGDHLPMFSMQVQRGGAHITGNSFDFDWLDKLFEKE